MSLVIKQEHTQTLKPQMINYMHMLQMDTIQLSAYLSNVVTENPVLEADWHHENFFPDPAQNSVTAQMQWLKQNDSQNYIYYSNDSPESREVGISLKEDLLTHLYFQLIQKKLSPPIKKLCLAIIASLDQDGYLRTPPEKIASASAENFSSALQIVQSLDPCGVAARSLSECLCLQLQKKGLDGLCRVIAEKHLSDVGNHAYAKIAHCEKVSESDVRTACDVIRTLDPRPCSIYDSTFETDYITPDVMIARSDDGEIIITMPTSLTPELHINSYYAELAKETDDEAVKTYLAQKMQQAKSIIQYISHRKSSICQCVEEIVRRQESFFFGSDALQPMTMEEIASSLGIHVSTVSRSLRGKYIQTPRGCMPASRLFTKHLSNSGRSSISSDRVKTILVNLIEREDKSQPLSDQSICNLLQLRNIVLSRRTVAKYRYELHIPSAAQRRV